MESTRSIQRALISVSNKTGIVDFAKTLTAQGVEILSTGGTAHLLQQHQIPVIEVCDFTGFPEIMDGRVKTLHPKIHGGILGRRERDDAIMQAHQIQPIDLVVVNLYPFANTIAQSDCDFEKAIEEIDIGGPTLIRAAAKNHRDVTVVVHHEDYARVLQEMQIHKNSLSAQTRFELALAAFEHTAAYDGMIAHYLGTQVYTHGSAIEKVTSSPTDTSQQFHFPQIFHQEWRKRQDLRYGENPHQKAAFYVVPNSPQASVASANQLQGKSLSFNNIADTDTALECVKTFEQAACVIVKHANPCGVALGENIFEAYERAYQTDPTSAFGGIIAFNRALDAQTAQAILKRQFVEVIIAPKITKDAIHIIQSKPNVRLLCCGEWTNEATRLDLKCVHGGLLIQETDQHMIKSEDLKIVSKRSPTVQERQDALFCWKVAKFVKSNAIVFAKDQMTLGIGAGQMSRVYSAKIAAMKAADENQQIEGSVMASDAFFPFRDSIDAAAQAGIRCIIQPGGSIRDQEIIDAANEHGIAMIFTHIRHFRH